MLTSKQRAKLRAMANGLDSIFQIGKNDIKDTLLQQLDDALEARELIKIKVLENSMISAREACDEICGALNAHPGSVIGSKMVIYRQSKNKKKIDI
jgi:RNA-binding protein